MKIIFAYPDGAIGILHPTQEALESMGIEAIADKDVPTGLPYKIVENDYLPEDRTFRDAWTIDSSLLTDGIGK